MRISALQRLTCQLMVLDGTMDGGNNSVNETSGGHSGITSALTSLAINIGGALATVGISKLASGSGSRALATGIPTNPVVVVPNTQGSASAAFFGSQAGASAAKYTPFLLFGGALLIGVLGFAALRR